MTESPIVSVCMIAFNQEEYIGEAIESVLRQETEYEIEIVIGEDSSSDGTRRVIEALIHRNPKIFNVHFNEKNIGMTKNFVSTISRCRGKYIAVLEGDDCWLGSEKIQKQVSILERDDSAVGAFHDCIVRFQETDEERLRIGNASIDQRVGLRSLICSKPMATATMVFRNCLNWPNLPGWFSTIHNPDYGKAVLLALHGDWVYLDEVLSVYRRHAHGIWSGETASSAHRKTIQFFRVLANEDQFAHVKGAIQWRLTSEYRRLAIALAEGGRSMQSWIFFLRGGAYKRGRACRSKVTFGRYFRALVKTKKRRQDYEIRL